MSQEQVREEIAWQIAGVESAANPEGHVARPRALAYRVLTVLGMELNLDSISGLEDEVREVLDEHPSYVEDVYSHSREYRIRDHWDDIDDGGYEDAPDLPRPKRRAITGSTIEDSQTAEQYDLATFLGLVADDIAELFEDDLDAGSIAYGWLLQHFGENMELPNHLADDQIEDWLIGHVIKLIIQTAPERQRVTSLLE